MTQGSGPSVAPVDPDHAALSGISLFRGVPARELERLAPLLHERSFPAGASVLTAEQPGEAIYVLLEGSVKVHLLTPGGAEVILAVLGPGEVVGEMSLADSLGRSASVTTLEESVLLWIDRATFRSGVEGSLILARNLADILSRRVRLANAHLLAMATLDVPGRVASQILSLSREYGRETPEGARIPLRLTQSDLAALVGASRVRVNQALGNLRKRAEISVGEDGRITVHDPDALSRRAR
jgi:CRP/FNR family transcriptional regulator, cyclic AMP receptor protein